METIRPHPDRGGWTLARALIAGEFRIDARDGPGWKSIGDILPFVLATMATMAKNDESPTRRGMNRRVELPKTFAGAQPARQRTCNESNSEFGKPQHFSNLL